MFKKTWMTLLLIVFAGFALRVAYAKPGFMNSFNTTYPTSLLINNCMVCHAGSPPDEDNLNRYGRDFDSNHENFRSIESLDSDRDGYSNIAEITAGTLPGDPTSNLASLTTGEGLYGTYCAGCHGPLATSTKIGRSATQIQNAINNNVGGMGSLNTLNPTQIQAIAAVLGQQTPPPPPPPTTNGPTLYSQNCAGCHGPLASSTKIGRSATQIQNAINNNVGGMGSLNTLNPTQIQAIAAVLGQQTPPPPPPPTTNGPTLYSQNCAGCHGPLASSTKIGRSATQIQNAINNNVGGMGSLNTLNPTQIQAIAAVLGQQTPPPPLPPTPITDGATLYGQNCAGCHGPLASSTKIGRSATQIQNAINANTGGMGNLSSLTPAQIDAIAAALSTGAPALTTVNVTPQNPSIAVGATQQLTASPLDQNGVAFNGATITWSSSKTSVATVSTTGNPAGVVTVTGVSVGTATITATASSGTTTITGTSVITVTATPTPPSPQPPTVNLTIWPGQWLKVTMKYQGYLFGKSNSSGSDETQNQSDTENPTMATDHENIVGYLKFVSWDTNQGVLQAEIHQKDSQTGQWVSDPLALHLIGGSPTDFLCWIQVNGDFTSGFVVRIQGKEKDGVLKSATFKTMGGYYFEKNGGTASSSSGSLAGAISISGSLVPEARVPVPK